MAQSGVTGRQRYISCVVRKERDMKSVVTETILQLNLHSSLGSSSPAELSFLLLFLPQVATLAVTELLVERDCDGIHWWY
jgi:hypothetical protein